MLKLGLLLGALARIIGLDLHSTTSNLSINGELHKLQGCLDSHSLAELMELTAQLCEVKAVHRNFRGVLCVRDTQMLTVQCNQIQTKLCPFFLACTKDQES